MFKTTLTAAAFAAVSSVASAGVLDFDVDGDCSGGGIVTLSTIDSTCVITGAPGGSASALFQSTIGGDSQARADFSAIVDMVSVDLGDFNADPDTIFLEVFSAANVSLGYTDLFRSAASESMDTLSLSASGIAYAVFGTNADDLGAIFADNLTWTVETMPAVPLPAGGLLALTGLAALGVARRRKTA